MPTFRKSKTVKKVTEIPSAKVTIEVEETEDKVEPQETADTQETPDAEEAAETPDKKTLEDMPVNIGDSSGGGFGLKKLLFMILIIVPVGFLVFGGFLYFSKNFNTDFLKNEPEKKLEIPENTPTPTVEEVDKEAYEIEVQNGSGIAGEGAKAGDMLIAEGFKVGDVGNADTSDYTDTIITVNDEVSEGYIEELTKVLEERGSVGKVKKFATGEDGEVLVIVGSNLSDTTSTP